MVRMGKGARRNAIILLLFALPVFVLATAYVGYRLIRHFRPKPLLMAGQDHSVTPIPNAYRLPNALDAEIQRMRRAAMPADPSQFKRADYLRLVQGIVDRFRRLQRPSGEIGDPFARREIQYATPNYALAAAMLVTAGNRPDLLDSASRALDRSLAELASGKPADRVGDFFIYPSMVAYRLLRERADPVMRERWEENLRKIDPDRAYSDRIGPGQPDVMNWNTNAIAGEFLRQKYGFAAGEFVPRYLDAQLPRFTPEGLYRDPDLPLVYDSAARFNLATLLEDGYRGPHRAALETLLWRGAWASLLMQSSAGDFPSGGRSAGHVWNDAMQCAEFELWARRAAAKGDDASAGMFRRAARRAAQSLERWVRPSGALWVVKNHFDPAKRFGYEDYSYLSQYNLLAAAYLALAWSFSGNEIQERLSPAETGDFVIDLAPFRKIFANFEGHYVEIDTGGDAVHNGTGLLREDRPGVAPLGGGGTAIGVAWRKAGGKVEALADMPVERVKARLIASAISKSELSFSVRYLLDGAAIRSVTEQYRLTPTSLVVKAVVDGPVEAVLVRYPALTTDGRDQAVLTVSGPSVEVRLPGRGKRFRVLTPSLPLRKAGTVQDRAGIQQYFEAETGDKEIIYQLDR